MKNATVVWDRASYLVVCPNIWAKTSEVPVEYADLFPKMALKAILELGYVFHYWPTEY